MNENQRQQLQCVHRELQKYFPQLVLNPSGQLVQRTHQHMATTGRVSLLVKSRRRGAVAHLNAPAGPRRADGNIWTLAEKENLSWQEDGRAGLVHTTASPRSQTHLGSKSDEASRGEKKKDCFGRGSPTIHGHSSFRRKDVDFFFLMPHFSDNDMQNIRGGGLGGAPLFFQSEPTVGKQILFVVQSSGK